MLSRLPIWKARPAALWHARLLLQQLLLLLLLLLPLLLPLLSIVRQGAHVVWGAISKRLLVHSRRPYRLYASQLHIAAVGSSQLPHTTV